MPLTPGESDRLQLFLQGQLARARRERGLRLNVPEATAYIADAICEWARDGLDLPTVRERARSLLGVDDVLPDVPLMLTEVRVEARFDDGTRLVVVTEPFGSVEHPVLQADPVPRADLDISLTNEAATPIAISSHIHLAEINPRIRLDRAAAFGRRLAIPAGATVWLAPGERLTLPTTPIAGTRTVVGNTGVVQGSVDDPDVRRDALAALRRCGYLDIVDGADVNSPDDASRAVARLVEERRTAP